MPSTDNRAVELIKIFGEMETQRRSFERTWQDIRDLVRVNSSDIQTKTTPGRLRTELVFDATAIDANNQLASGLHSYLTNPVERWFSIMIQGVSAENYDEETLAWLEVVSDTIYNAYQREESGFNTCLHECYLDIGAFGTMCPYQEWDPDRGNVRFKSFPIADVYFRESSNGMIDTVGRRQAMTMRQIEQQFEDLPEELARMKDKCPSDRKFNIVHLVLPRTDRVVGKLNKRNKKFASFWLCLDTKEIISESGYDEQPYAPARWMKVPEEVYGRGPASNCLPDIKMVNVMERTMIKAGQKIVDPPLQVPNEGFMAPLETAPGSLLFKEPGVENIEPLLIQGNLPWGFEQAEQKRNAIKTAFHSDWLRMEKQNKEMTAFEVSDRRSEKLQLLSPMMSRLQAESLGPIIRRTFILLKEHGRIPAAPTSMHGSKLAIEYISPAARAQIAVKAGEMGQFVTEIIPLAQLNPTILDNIDFDKFVQALAKMRGTTRTIIRTRKDLDQVRAARQQQQESQQMLEAAEPATKAISNLATAKEKGFNIGGLLNAQ